MRLNCCAESFPNDDDFGLASDEVPQGYQEQKAIHFCSMPPLFKNGHIRPILGSITKPFVSKMDPLFLIRGLTPSGLFMGSNSTLIYTSELILCFTIGEMNIR